MGQAGSCCHNAEAQIAASRRAEAAVATPDLPPPPGTRGDEFSVIEQEPEPEQLAHEVQRNVEAAKTSSPLAPIAADKEGQKSFSKESPVGDGDKEADKTSLRRTLTRQAAGHGGANIMKDWTTPTDDSGVPEFIIKGYDAEEARNYKTLHDAKDPLCAYIARYGGDITAPGPGKDGKEEKFMRLENLLRQFKKGPHVMDCKMGIRSYSEEEAVSNAPRPDLFERMMKFDPTQPTAAEKAAGSVTKCRWMSFNDTVMTSLSDLGFRIDGIAHSAGEVTKKDLKRIKAIPDVVECIMDKFLPERQEGGVGEVAEDEEHLTEEARAAAFCNVRVAAAQNILQRLRDMRQKMQESPFLQKHEVIGSSLLFIVEAHGSKGSVFLIDFAKTMPLPPGVKIDHVSPWALGNHEDGLMKGMNSQVEVWSEVVRRAKAEAEEKQAAAAALSSEAAIDSVPVAPPARAKRGTVIPNMKAIPKVLKGRW